MGATCVSRRRGRTKPDKSRSRQGVSDPIISRRSGERRYESHSAKSTSLEAGSVSLSATSEGTCAQSQRPIPPCPPRTCHYTASRACQLGGPWTRWLTTKDRNRINPASPGPSRPFPQCQRPTRPQAPNASIALPTPHDTPHDPPSTSRPQRPLLGACGGGGAWPSCSISCSKLDESQSCSGRIGETRG